VVRGCTVPNPAQVASTGPLAGILTGGLRLEVSRVPPAHFITAYTYAQHLCSFFETSKRVA
jgi:hypothetical protein